MSAPASLPVAPVAYVQLESSQQPPKPQPAMGDRLVVRQVANDAHGGSLRVNVHGKIFKFRISQPSTHATLNYAGRVTVGGQSLEKMAALELKIKNVLEKAFTPQSVQDVREINFHLHRGNPRAAFGLKSFSTRANNSDQFVDHWFPGLQNGEGLGNRIANRRAFTAAMGELNGVFTQCENDRVEEAKQRRNNPPPAPQPGQVPHNAPGNGNPVAKKKHKRKSSGVGALANGPHHAGGAKHPLKRSGSQPNPGRH
jgi:hypothetical protein